MKRLLVLMFVLLVLFSAASAALAVDTDDSPAPAPEASTVVDVDSRYDYMDIFDRNNTRYDGRIWTDKSVLDTEIVYSGKVHEYGEEGTGSVTVGMDSGEDFLVSYSALASTTRMIEYTAAPLDLVMVLDMSPEMGADTAKITGMLDAAEHAINSIMAMNEQNRVAVVAYSSDNLVLMPLAHYSSVDLTYHHGIDDVTFPDGAQTQNFVGYVITNYVSDGQSGSAEPFPIYVNNDTVNKYTQYALYRGMQLLAEEESVSIIAADGTTIHRQPALILLAEGEPKIGSSQLTSPTQPTRDIYGVTDNNRGVDIERNRGYQNNRANDDDRHAQTFATLLTAAYMKNQVTENYNGSGANERAMQIYTMGVDIVTADSPSLAEIALNPKDNLGNSNLPLGDKFEEYAESYFSETGSVTITNAGNPSNDQGGVTTFTREEPDLGLTDIDELRYNDNYFEVNYDENFDWNAIFDIIIAQVMGSTPKVPTLIEDGYPPNESGWLRYEDPLGDYMEVKDVKALVINDVIYRADRISEVEDGVYVVNGTATNPVYGAHDLSDIEIYIDTDEDGRQIFHVDIPAALLPLRQTTVTKDVNDQIIGLPTTAPFPSASSTPSV